MKVKPTITELEAILAEEPGSIEIQPDGSVKTVSRDVLWCRALLSSELDTRDMGRVLNAFNELRPD